MKISDCSRMEQDAPRSGWMLAYTRLKVFFEPYHSLEEVSARLENAQLLELHLFDREREYRCLESRSCRYEANGGKVEAVADFPEDENVYREEILLEERWGRKKITVLNRIHYGEDSAMGYIDNYRLVMEGEN